MPKASKKRLSRRRSKGRSKRRSPRRTFRGEDNNTPVTTPSSKFVKELDEELEPAPTPTVLAFEDRIKYNNLMHTVLNNISESKEIKEHKRHERFTSLLKVFHERLMNKTLEQKLVQLPVTQHKFSQLFSQAFDDEIKKEPDIDEGIVRFLRNRLLSLANVFDEVDQSDEKFAADADALLEEMADWQQLSISPQKRK